MAPLSILYLGLLGLAAGMAVGERAIALRHENRLRREGGTEVAPGIFRLMVPVYALQFPACALEHLLLERRPHPLLLGGMAALFLLSKALKLWAVAHLGGHWTMRVILPPRLAVVTTGPYAYLRHPNYLAVIGEMASLPLAGGAFITALAGLALFLPLLHLRIRTEEAALMARPGYAETVGRLRRLLPGGRR